MKFPDVAVKHALVTGCSSGIGWATAHELQAAGWKVAATARKPDDVRKLTAAGFDAIALDVADPESVKLAVEQVTSIFGGVLGVLVNNAGFGQVGALEDLSRDMLDYQFQVNVIGLQDITNRLIPMMRRQGYGRIINVSSVLGRVSLPFMGSYSATKFAVEGLSDALRVELKGSGIAVSLVEPGPIATAFRENAASRAKATLDPSQVVHRAYYEKEIDRREKQNANPDPFTLEPETVARKILHAVTSARPKTRYKVTFPAYAGAFMARFAPDGLIDWIMAKQTR